jgi:NAD-dependent deacetylase
MSARTDQDIAIPLARRIAGAPRVVALTGAGMSADSGVPTFRGGQDSLWSQFDPMRLATSDAFAADPDLVWGWYAWRMALVAQARPNAGHLALAALADRHPEVRVVTQNVDDLHERAGSADVVHLHGSLFRPRCSECAAPCEHDCFDATLATRPSLRLAPPRCRRCEGRIRPGVVWFGESLPTADWQTAQDLLAGAGVVLVIGTSGQVYPAAGLASMAREHGAFVVEINPDGGGLPGGVDLVWRATAATALPALVDQLDAGVGAAHTRLKKANRT